MKRLLFSACLAVFIHACLLGVDPGWLRTKPTIRPETVPVSLSLNAHAPERPSKKPTEKKRVRPEPPLKKKKKLPEVRKAPKKKRSAPRKKPVRMAAHPPVPKRTLEKGLEKNRTVRAEKPAATLKTPQKEKPERRDTPPKPGSPLKKSVQNRDPIPADASSPGRVARTPDHPVRLKSREVPEPEAAFSSMPHEGALEKKVHSPKPVTASPAQDRPSAESRPVYLHHPAPAYPRLARKRRYEGTVILEVLVNQEGRVSELSVFKSSGFAVLDRAALKAVKKWRFEPGRKGVEKAAQWVNIPVRFKLK